MERITKRLFPLIILITDNNSHITPYGHTTSPPNALWVFFLLLLICDVAVLQLRGHHSPHQYFFNVLLLRMRAATGRPWRVEVIERGGLASWEFWSSSVDVVDGAEYREDHRLLSADRIRPPVTMLDLSHRTVQHTPSTAS